MLNKIFDLLVDNRRKFNAVNVENNSENTFTYDYRYNYKYKDKIELQLRHSGTIDGSDDDTITIVIKEGTGASHITFTPKFELLFGQESQIIDKKTLVYEEFYNKLKNILESVNDTD